MTFVANATTSSSRSNDDAMSETSWRRSDKEIDVVPPPPFGLMGVAGNLCVARHRRCPCITSSLLLDLPSHDPSASVMVFLGRDTIEAADLWPRLRRCANNLASTSEKVMTDPKSLESIPSPRAALLLELGDPKAFVTV